MLNNTSKNPDEIVTRGYTPRETQMIEKWLKTNKPKRRRVKLAEGREVKIHRSALSRLA
jgi:hypothetical protein